jgi:hypothetical protein
VLRKLKHLRAEKFLSQRQVASNSGRGQQNECEVAG